MKEKTIEVKVTKKVFCYKEVKAKGQQNLSPDCPFNLKNYEDEKCTHCRWNGETILSSEIIGEMKKIEEDKPNIKEKLDNN